MEPGNAPRPNPSAGGGRPAPDQQPTSQLPRVDPPAGPPPVTPPPTGPPADEGGNGKKWTIIGLAAVLVAALAVGGFVLANKGDDTGGGTDEVFLTAAADPGQDPFSNASFAATPDPAIATAATGATPSGQSASATTSTGDTPALYGGTNSLIVCDADKMATFLAANPDKAKAWVQALNDDPNLRADGGTLTTAGIPAYLATLTPILLVADTRVTNHGFANGSPTKLQSILQKGTAVFVDKYGVPRVRCACGNPLNPPKATKQKYRGKTWTGFSLSNIKVVQPAAAPLTSFRVLVPARPGGTVSRLPLGPFACVVSGGPCKTPSGVTKRSATGVPGTSSTATPTTSAPVSTSAPAPSAAPQTSSVAPPTTSAAPTSTAAPSSTASGPQETTKSGTITADKQQVGNGRTSFILSFRGYSPNSKVTYTCTDPGGVLKQSVIMDSSGSYQRGNVGCENSNGVVTVTDEVGGRFSF